MDRSEGAPRYAVESRDIEYCRHGGKPLLARLYRPVGAPGARPAVVDVHGGAWTSADRTQNAVISTALAAAGTVVLALDFRMPPEARYPAAIQDINLGIRFLKAHAAEYGSHAARVGGFAGSSGGHQLMLAALRPGDPRYAALPLTSAKAGALDARLAFIALGWPVLDPLRRYQMAQERGNTRLLEAHHAFFGGEAAMIEGNPQLVLERGEATDLPPALILQGTNDDNLPPDMADRFVAAYRARGGTVTLEKFPGEPHTFITKDPASAAAQRGLALIKAFIAAQAGA